MCAHLDHLELKYEMMACGVQVAQFSAEMERYEPAIQIYEDVAHRSMDNNLLKFSAKGYLLNAGICRLCGQSPAAPQLLQADILS